MRSTSPFLALPPGLDPEDHLLWAAKWGSLAELISALDRKPKIDIRHCDGWTPLLVSVARDIGDESGGRTALLLARGADLEFAHASSGETALHVALNGGGSSMALELLRAGANPDARDKHGFTCLIHASCARGLDGELIDAMAKLSKDVDLHGPQGTALHSCAASSGETIMARHLLLRGADLDARDSEDWTPLHIAAVRSNLPMIALLLDNGADVGARERQATTALMLAAQAGGIEGLELLVRGGADLLAQDAAGKTAADHAKENRADDAWAWLRSQEALAQAASIAHAAADPVSNVAKPPRI